MDIVNDRRRRKIRSKNTFLYLSCSEYLFIGYPMSFYRCAKDIRVILWPCNTGRATACVRTLRVLAWECLVLCPTTWWQVLTTTAALNVPPVKFECLPPPPHLRASFCNILVWYSHAWRCCRTPQSGRTSLYLWFCTTVASSFYIGTEMALHVQNPNFNSWNTFVQQFLKTCFKK